MGFDDVHEGVFGFSGNERFELRRCIGSGGMGVVYEAWDAEREAVVALKTLHRLSPQSLYRFKQEFRALRDICHPNLVTLFELFEVEGHWFYTMELVEGQDFISWCRPPRDRSPIPATSPSYGRFDEKRLRSALEQVAVALDALHRAGKVHRDVKPSNILITSAGRVVLLDFGLVTEAHRTQRSTSGTKVMGTIAYMSPEQAADEDVGPAADWYALGTMLFETLTGRLPFEGSPAKVFVSKLRRRPPAPRSLDPGVPKDLDRLCVDLLSTAPSRRPTGDQVLERLSSEVRKVRLVSSLPSAKAPKTFVGRERELEILRKALTATSLARPVRLFVSGPSGIGKTALVQRFLDDLRRSGEAVVLEGRCYEGEFVPYKAFDSVVDSLSAFLRKLDPITAASCIPRDILALSRVFPVLRRVPVIAEARGRTVDSLDPHEQRRKAFDALREMLARIADAYSLVLFIDDLQWGDEDSAKLLVDLMSPPDPPPMLFVGTLRDSAAESSFVRVLRERGQGQCAELNDMLVLEPLDPKQATQLALVALGGDDSERRLAEVIGQKSSGVPYLIGELARSIEEGLAVDLEPSERTTAAIGEVVRERLRQLGDEARRLLELVCVAGRPLPRAQAIELADVRLSGDKAIRLLGAAGLARVVIDKKAEALVPSHDIVRATVVEGMSPRDRRTWHERVLSALGEHETPEVTLKHAFEAGDFERAGRAAERAATLASQALAFNRAIQLYQLALRLGRGDEARERRINVQLGDAFANAGRCAEAAQAYLSAAQTAPPNESAMLRRKGAVHLLRSGHIDRGLQVLRDVVGRTDLDLETEEDWASVSAELWRRLDERGLEFEPRAVEEIEEDVLARHDLSWSASHGLSAADAGRGLVFVLRHALDALDLGEPARVARALSLLLYHGGGSFAPGSARRQELLDQAREMTRALDDPYTRGWLRLAEGATSVYGGELRGASAALRDAEDIFRNQCRGATRELAGALNSQFFAFVESGDLREVIERHPQWLKEAEERDDLYLRTSLEVLGADRWLALDAPDVAEARVVRALARWSWHQVDLDVLTFWGLLARTRVELYRGGAAAWQLLRAEGRPFRVSLLADVNCFRVAFRAVEARTALAAAALDGRHRAKLLERTLWRVEQIEEIDLPAWRTTCEALRGAVARGRGDVERAIERFEAAERRSEEPEGNRLVGACARWRRGELLGGDVGQALIDQARGALLDMGTTAPERYVNAQIPDPD